MTRVVLSELVLLRSIFVSLIFEMPFSGNSTGYFPSLLNENSLCGNFKHGHIYYRIRL
jgi:hypothetical protein